eukprot:1689078-Rhodomonas_salina.1
MAPAAPSGGGGGGSPTLKEKWLPADKPRCKYGIGCRRQNPTHFAEEGHPASHTSPHIPKPPPSPKKGVYDADLLSLRDVVT